MVYQFYKAAHLVSLFVWISGMVAVALSLRFHAVECMKQLKAFDRYATSPAMVSAWVFGILLVIEGGWFPQPWLVAKVFVVLVLSGVHGALTGTLRRATEDPTELESGGSGFLLPVFLIVTAIVLIVTMKP